MSLVSIKLNILNLFSLLLVIMINFFKNLNPFYFIVSFCLGILYCYLTQPLKKVVIKHPTLENSNKIIYRESNDDTKCFRYKVKEVQCPKNENSIVNNPINIK